MHRTICHWDSRLGLELLHDVEEVVVNGRLVAKLQLHLVQVRQGILHLQHIHIITIITLDRRVNLGFSTKGYTGNSGFQAEGSIGNFGFQAEGSMGNSGFQAEGSTGNFGF